MESFAYYIFCIIIVIVAIFLFKKVASCLIKSIIFAVILAALAAVYWLYFK